MSALFESRPHPVPVWFMRQAGRYHAHYQHLRAQHDFLDLCRTPDLAALVTMGPIRDFDFDAAILFSDILFPLDAMGMNLRFDPSPKLDFKLQTQDDLSLLRPASSAYFQFQHDACRLIRSELDLSKSLIGFVGAPFTLYVYAVHGTHSGNLLSAKQGLSDGRYAAFLDHLLPLLLESMEAQARGGIDTLALFDTAAGELSPRDFNHYLIPALRDLVTEFKKRHPAIRVLYYSKGTNEAHLDALRPLLIDAIGVDWRVDMKHLMDRFADRFYIQGNLDPVSLFKPWHELEADLLALCTSVTRRDRWIMNLGHGVLPGTPEEHVEQTVQAIRRFTSK